MEDFFFNGLWRMDWGLGNPNKTAILIAELLICIWGLTYIKKNSFFVVAFIFLLLGIALIHTFSRGGLIAATVSCSILFIFNQKNLLLSRRILLLTIVIFLICYSIFIGFGERCIRGFSSGDRSVTNRIDMWKTVPYMIADAPNGWGWGEAGVTYIKWYQAPERKELYRTLVNSHFTWLVEGNYIFRVFYISAWIFIFLCCYPIKKWLVLSLSIWICFGIGAFFSSVAESIILWVIPVLALIPIIYFTRNIQHAILLLSISIVMSSIINFSIFTFFYGKSGIKFANGNTIYGNSKANTWIINNDNLLGEYEYAKNLRKNFNGNKSVGFAPKLSTIPLLYEKPELLIMPGLSTYEELMQLQILQNYFDKIILLAPECTPLAVISMGINFKKIRVIFGEYSQSPYLFSWENSGILEVQFGHNDFFSDLLNLKWITLR